MNTQHTVSRSNQRKDFLKLVEKTSMYNTKDVLISALGSARYNKKDSLRIRMVCINLFLKAQDHRNQNLKKSQLKISFQIFYHTKVQMECYHFCKDNFDKVNTNKLIQTLFAIIFCCPISFCFHQQKQRIKGQIFALGQPQGFKQIWVTQKFSQTQVSYFYVFG